MAHPGSAAPRPPLPAPLQLGLQLAMLLLLAVLLLLPLLWLLSTSLKGPQENIFTSPPALLPSAPSLEAYRQLFTTQPMLAYLGNSTIVSAIAVLANLLFCSLAAYPLARLRFAGRGLVLALVVATILIPFQVVMIPNFLLVADMGLLDSLTALVLPHFASALAVLLLAQAMRSFPREVLEAAHMDGASDWRLLWQVVLPNMVGSVASLAILIFISTWNDYFWPLLLSRTAENSVIQIGVQMFMTSEGNQWGPLMAASTMASLPILALYIALQRQVVQSFMQSGLR